MNRHSLFFAARLLLLALLVFCSLVPQVAWSQVVPADPAATAQATTDPNAVQNQTGGMNVLNTFSALPSIRLTNDEEGYGLPIQLLLLLTVLSLAPAIVILMTSFTRLVVIFGILRTALGTHQSPPTQVITGLALFLTFFIMAPAFRTINDTALQPYIRGDITQEVAVERATGPMKQFMLNQTREKDLMLFMDIAKIESFDSAADVPLHVLVPSFVISELRIAFQIGFMIFLPFLIVDLIVASVLMSMGMMMLPPVMVSLPLKLLLFVLSDGWYLIVQSVVQGYRL